VNTLPDDVVLINGAGQRENHQLCVMTAVAWAAGEPHSDAPECACPVAARIAIRINDGKWWKDDAERTAALLPLVPRLVGSRASREVTIARARLAARWALETAAPRSLEVFAGLMTDQGEANELRAWATKLRRDPRAQVARDAASAARAIASRRWTAAAAAAWR